MLRITIPPTQLFDDVTETFIDIREQVVQLEHSLVSLSKWESKWKKPFLSKEEKTLAETIDYVRCMTVSQNIDENVYKFLTNDNLRSVRDYIEDSMTATTFSESEKKPSREVITAEIIYFWMITQNIPFECQKWHLNRLLTLINVCSIKNAPQKKMGKKELAQRNSALNAARRQAIQNGG